MPTAVIKSGHFVANFREGGVWYKSDDSVLSVVDPTQPMAFPYLCIFERVGLPLQEPWVSKQLLATESGYSESCGMPASKRRRLHVKTKVEKPFASETHRGLPCGKKQDRTGREKVRLNQKRTVRVKGGADQKPNQGQRCQSRREPQGRTEVLKTQIKDQTGHQKGSPIRERTA